VNLTKKTLFWVFVLIMLSGSFYFLDQKAEDNQRINEASLKLLPFSVDDITEFWINDKREGRKIKLVRGSDGWMLSQPLAVKGDDGAIERLLINIVKTRKDAILFTQPEPGKLQELGLASPDLEMGISAGGEDVTILFGTKGPTHNVAYVMFKGRPEVYRVHSDVKKEATQSIYALRDKNILDIEPVKLRRLEVERKGMERVVIEHHRGKWNMLEPQIGRASMTKVLESLYEVNNALIKAFVDESSSDLASYGLASPDLVLTIYEDKKQLPKVLYIGGKDRKRRGYFARTNQTEDIFVIEEDLVNSIIVSMGKWLE